MQFQTHNNTSIDIGGTSLRGIINVYPHQLEKVFGKAMQGDGEKTQNEWHIAFDDGAIATVYDWKGSDYFNAYHVGGNCCNAFDRVNETLNKMER